MKETEQNTSINGLAWFAVRMARTVFPCTRWFSILSLIATGAMALIVSADVFMRRVFNAPIYGSYDYVNILLVVIVFGSVAYVETQGGHVIVDTVTRLYPRWLGLLSAGIAQLMCIILLALTCWQTVCYGLAMLKAGESMVLTRIPVAPFLFIVAFGYALYALVLLIRFLFTLAGVKATKVEALCAVRSNHGHR